MGRTMLRAPTGIIMFYTRHNWRLLGVMNLLMALGLLLSGAAVLYLGDPFGLVPLLGGGIFIKFGSSFARIEKVTTDAIVFKTLFGNRVVLKSTIRSIRFHGEWWNPSYSSFIIQTSKRFEWYVVFSSEEQIRNDFVKGRNIQEHNTILYPNKITFLN